MEGMIIPVPSTEPLTSRSAQTVWIWDTDASYIPVERVWHYERMLVLLEEEGPRRSVEA